MQPNVPSRASRVEYAMEWVFLAVFSALVLYAVVGWVNVHPAVQIHEPVGFLLLTVGMWLQPFAALVRHRSRKLSYALVGSSLVVLIVSLRFLSS